MRVNELILAIKSQYLAPADKRVAIFVRGPPGVGKSEAPCQASAELAAELGLPYRNLTAQRWTPDCAESFCCMPLQATIEDPITISGLPGNDPNDAYSAIFKIFKDKLPTAGCGILVIEEINTAPPMVQAGFYSLFLNGKMGSYVLPAGWYVIATGNRDEDRAATQRIPMPLIGRWCRIKVEPDLGTWTRWALAHGVRTELIAFYQFRPELFDTFDATKPEPYSCARTAVFASHIMDSAPDALEHEMLAGVVGDGVATELMAFCQIYRNLVSPDQILLNPDTANVPDEPATLYAVAGALAAKATPENFERMTIYCERMPAEYAVLLVKLAIRRDPAIAGERAFSRWVANNDEILA